MKNQIKSLLRGSVLLTFISILLWSCSSQDEAVIKVIEHEISESDQFISEPINGQYMVTLNDETFGRLNKFIDNYDNMLLDLKNRILDEFGSSMGLTDDDILFVYAKTFRGFTAKLDEAQLAKLRIDKNIKSIEQDQMIILKKPDNPGGGKGGGGDEDPPSHPAQSTPWGISRVGGAGDGTGKRAWIIDSGIDMDHDDLNVDASASRSYITKGRKTTSPDDENGHGTHVAGTVAAIDNNIGVIGVAAGAAVVSVRVLDRNGSGSVSGVVAGVDYVASAANGEVANMSLGGSVSSTLDQAVIDAADAGVTFAIAAGNSSSDANNSSPARVNHDRVYTVSAMNSSDAFASFSNYGNPPIDYCAPGVGIPSLWKDNGYNTISGTSMASPHVCGILVLGSINSTSTVSGDPDGNPDPIATR